MKTRLLSAFLIAAALLVAMGQQAPSRRTPPRDATKSAGSSASQAATPKFKAIWEPVNYGEDLGLTDVFFVNEQVGWVSGEKGTILHTRDGGTTWKPQLGGDPKSAGPVISDLFFIDEKHGWAAQRQFNKLLRTTDGESWEEVGTFQFEWHDYQFTSPTNGVYVRKTQIQQTQDGGRTWKEAFTCKAKVEVDGLSRELECNTRSVDFTSASVGYVISSALRNRSRAILKTEDGGAGWSIGSFATLTGDNGYEGRLVFSDESTGFITTPGGKLFKTTDAGKTWTGVVANVGREVRFADANVGWSMGNTFAGAAFLTYTTDGGKRWTSREFKLPAPVGAFSLPKRDRGYVVGDHGMVYRYRVVPVDYTAKGMIDAPMMGSSSAAPSAK